MIFPGLLLMMMFTNDFINCNEIKDSQVSYNPAELLSNIFGAKLTYLNENGDTMELGKETQLDNVNKPRQYDFVFDQEKPITFEDNEQNSDRVISEFQDQNKKKRRRRRRKPKNQMFLGSGEMVHQRPGHGSFGGNPYVNPGFSAPHQPYYRPPRFQKPSIASEALTTISGALTSIALYDDQQCVPRLLCEAAGGGKLGSTSLLQPIAGLQPLLTLLSAYNGISTSPLFIFGRAVFLGMTSKDNPGTCRYAYPRCPTDPEKLVHYLNNHNGGFFRFFNAPQQGQQNLNQFYNQLSGSYGLYQQNLNQNKYHNNQANDGYGFYQSNQQNQDGDQVEDQGYGLYKPNAFNNPQTYSSTYKYDNFNFENDNDFAKRILNSPSNNFLEDNDAEDEYGDTKLTFPDNNDFYERDNIRDVKRLKFPDEELNAIGSSTVYNDYQTQAYTRRGKSILFPDSKQPSRYTNENKYTNTHTTNTNVNDYVFDYEHNFYVKKVNNDDGLKTVYVVRGNGDPNHPEIIKVKPGELLI